MKLFRSTLVVSLLVFGLAGCTYAEPVPDRVSEQGVPSPTSTATTPAIPVKLQGQFQSQGAATTGTATIHVTEASAYVQLDDFSTGSGDSVRLVLSPGTVRPGPGGELELSSSTFIDLGPSPLSQSSSQRIEMDPKMWKSMPGPVRSVVIYNFAEKTAYGAANLIEMPHS